MHPSLVSLYCEGGKVMQRRYAKPPLVEALCEFQFIPTGEWDMTIPGLIYERIKESFPEKKQTIGIGIQMHPTEKGIEHRIEPAPPKIQFIKKDKCALIQVAPNLLVVNQLKPYPAWENFKKMILDNFHIYKEIATPKGLKRISLRYINIFEFQESKIELQDFFKFYPSIPKDLPQIHGPFLMRVEFPYDSDSEALVLSLGSTIPAKKNTIALLLDIDYRTIKPESVSFDEIPDWLDKAHNRIEMAFEACITDKLRESFEEAKA